MNVVQVGLGNFGRNWYTEVLQDSPDVRVVSLVEPFADALGLLRQEVDLGDMPVFSDLETALDALSRRGLVPEAAVVTASLPAHVPVATAAIEAGLHVLVEKPLAATVAEARGLVELAARNRRILMVSQNYRFFPAPRYARRLVEDGQYGELGDIEVDFRRNLSWSFELSNPLIVDVAIHHLDLMRMLCGSDAKRVRCATWNPSYSKFRHPPCAALEVEMATGGSVAYRGSLCSRHEATPWGGTWHLGLAEAGVTFSSFYDRAGERDELVIRNLNGEVSKIDLGSVDLNKTGERRGSLAEFVRCVRDGEEPETSGARNIGSIALMHAALRASQTGGWVEVEQA